MAARRFLYVIAGLIMLTLAAAIGWNLFQDQILRFVFVPDAPFAAMSDDTAPDYGAPSGWLARPDMADDPARWAPRGFSPGEKPQVAVFYVLPTTYLASDRWNAPYDDVDAGMRQRLFAMSQASAFNNIGDIWVPRYRQASIGAFLSRGDNAERALNFAYADVARAFDAFLAAIPSHQPILLAGHSQGSLHLLRLLRERVAGTPVARRIVAAYVVGWPISVTHDLPALGLPACDGPDATGCILSWQSFASPADPHHILGIYDRSTGFDGQPRKGSPMLCINPVSGRPNDVTPAQANRGALVPDARLLSAEIAPGRIAARCTPQGWLDIGAPPKGFGTYVLPGNNYHVFDYALFWADIRADAERRTQKALGK